ncbi:sugar O-acetyltransferase [Cryptosporangium phraense]|nr:sugar O-acetyltransferase [Cryptosporangium phraense]
MTIDSAPSQRERMLAGDLFRTDGDVRGDLLRAMGLMRQYNEFDPQDLAGASVILRDLLGSLGDDTYIRPPFYCDYGWNVHVGSRVFANFGLTALDNAPITIGDDCQIGPGVQLLTATHPMDPAVRREGWQSGEAITIGNTVWLGGGVIVCPGVSIGDDAVIGAGAVVTRDIPAGAVAVGNPARVIRSVY